MDAAAQGEKALRESNAPLAIQHFTRALSEIPAPTYYIQRSIAYSRLKQYDGGPRRAVALRDAEIALFLAQERGKRELILLAQMRRAITLFQMERYSDALYLFEQIESMIGNKDTSASPPEDIQPGATKKDGYSDELPIWLAKARKKLSEIPEGDDKRAVCVVEYPPDTQVPTQQELKAEWERMKSGQSASATATSKKPQAAAQPAPDGGAAAASSVGDAKPEQKPVDSLAAPIAEKVRHDWYQSQYSVVVTLYVKNVSKAKVQSEMKDNSVSIQLTLPSGSEYDFTLNPLYAPIDTSSSKITIMGTKIEIVLQKQVTGQKWSALEAPAGATKLTDRPAATTTTTAAPASSGPAYPTSSRHGAKDWDKVASSLQKPMGPSGDGNESDDSDLGGDAVDSFFKKLYAGADPDTRRAMMKSYIESNGTSLSTNWSEVGSKKVEAHPSD
ncbi:hypothetical protein N7493_010345 [Penicillium malachiteum]|uniref:SGT1 and CS domain protein n=1 Tax=Penicillium malachiteum TaxID=1324776 RepID=A0AAD6MRK1_9EURO|nr:hypothetical protein N7493_010345 [Penicillium malachiteum]